MRAAALGVGIAALGFVASAEAQVFEYNIGDMQSGKWFCVIEKIVGIISRESRQSEELGSSTMQLSERHKRFTLNITQIQRDQWKRDFCFKSLSFWGKMLFAAGAFTKDDTAPISNHIYRSALGSTCFSSSEATIQYFDRDHSNEFENYDFVSNMFSSFPPGNWLTLERDGSFQGGEIWDKGPVVFSGKCESLN